jgi:GT2 family glycosyltransferase
MISVCVAVHRVHGEPNTARLCVDLPDALNGHDGELVVALNGVAAADLDLDAAARTIDLEVNRGVAPAWNAAARQASGDLLAFCNDDVELGTGSLGRIVEALEELPDAVVGPLGSRWDLALARHVSWVRPDASTNPTAECDVVSGFLFGCRRATWEAVGGFDEFYAPASWEEVDFCTAVRAEGGHCFAIAGVDFKHEWGVSRRQPPWARAHWDGRSETWRSIHRRNKRHFLAKWGARRALQGSPDAATPR